MLIEANQTRQRDDFDSMTLRLYMDRVRNFTKIEREILKYAILNICHGGSNLIEIRIKWKKEGVHYSNFNIPAIKSQQCLYIVYLQRNTLSIRSEGDELTCGNLQYSILVMFLAFSAKVVLVTLLAHLIFNTQQKVASMHPSTAHCATFSIKKVPK